MHIMRAVFLRKIKLLAATCLLLSLSMVGVGRADCPAGAGFSFVQLTAERLQDDLDPASLSQAIAQSRAYYKVLDGSASLPLCGGQVSVARMDKAMARLANWLDRSEGEGLAAYLLANFDFCQAESLLVTGYYEPLLQGSLAPTPLFRHALYGPPPEELRGASRRQLEEDELLQGYELAYLANPVDLFFVHVQGSAVLQLPDGSGRRVHYVADNGHPYSSIGRVLIDEGVMAEDEVSLATIKDYLGEQPHKITPLLQQNSRYIYFSLSSLADQASGPPGALGQPLVAGRSVALDHDCYAAGGLGWLESRLPAEAGKRPLSRLVANHDRGAAINGNRRLDLFVGQGGGAGAVAGEMKEVGRLLFLVPKDKGGLSFRP